MVHFAQLNDNGKLLPINKACIHKDIFVVGLNEDEILYSKEPHYIQNENGLLVGINPQYSRFYVMNKERNVVQTLPILWSEVCTTVNDETFLFATDVQANSINYSNLMIGFIVFVLIASMYRIARQMTHV